MKKVTGLGGIFFKCQDPDKMKSWYAEHLGLKTDAYGTNFEWRQADNNIQKGFTQWSPFAANSKYMAPSPKDFMINYRVENLAALLIELKAAGIDQIGETMVEDYGKFAHILDPEGNKIELWEPNDEAYDGIVDGRTF